MPEITDEQRRAYESLADPSRTFTASEMAILAPLLPSELTNPQPVLPTEPGWYRGYDKVAQDDVTLRLRDDGQWGHGLGGYNALAQPERFAPFTRLVPERPQITREQIESACTEARADRPNPPQVYAILALVNGAAK